MIRPAEVKQLQAEAVMNALCDAHGLPRPLYEYAFAPWPQGPFACAHDGQIYVCRFCGVGRRRWRFDYLFEGWLAVEKEGGAFANGRHTRGDGYRDDLEKYNAAVVSGYAVLRFLPEQFDDGSAFAVIREALYNEGEQP